MQFIVNIPDNMIAEKTKGFLGKSLTPEEAVKQVLTGLGGFGTGDIQVYLATDKLPAIHEMKREGGTLERFELPLGEKASDWEKELTNAWDRVNDEGTQALETMDIEHGMIAVLLAELVSRTRSSRLF